MHPELRPLARSHPFRPHVSEQAVGEETELCGCVGVWVNDDFGALRAEAGFLEGYAVVAGREIDVDSTAGGGAGGGDIFAFTFEIEDDVGERGVVLVADISYMY